MNILEVNDVVKKYESHTAVNHVSFNIPKGTIFGLLGPNGAGKTSLIRMITTIIKADSGTILLNGESLNDSTAEKIGYMPEERGLYKKMKIGEHLLYLAQLKGMSYDEANAAIKSWMEKFQIMDWWNKKVEELSKGMQQKVQFIATVLHEPSLIILDEPFSGLDPINANLIKEEISLLHKKGISIIFSTHRMEQVEEICDNIVLINKGKIILQGEVKSLRNKFKENIYEFVFNDDIPTQLPSDFEVIHTTVNSISFKLQENQSANDLLRYFVNNNQSIQAFREVLPSFNEIFIRQVELSNS